MRIAILALYLLAYSWIFADASTAYVTAQGSSNVSSVDLITGNTSTVTTIPGAQLLGITLANSTTAYVTGGTTNLVYALDLTTGIASQVTPSPITGATLFDIKLADSTTAYVAGFSDHNIYRVNLTNGTYSRVTPSPVTAGGLNGLVLDMSLTTPTTAYVSANNGTVSRVDLTNGNVSLIGSIPVALEGISLANNTTAYVTGFDGNVYSVDLTSGNFSLVTPSTTNAHLQGIAISNSTTAYTVGFNTNEVYLINLINGSFSQVTPAPFAVTLADISLVLQIGTTGLHGNNLKFAEYLNNNAPFITLQLIALQSDIPSALEMAAPTRNAIFTFAAGKTQLAFGQLVADHLGQKRWDRAWHQGDDSQKLPSAVAQTHRLVADVSLDSATDIATDTARDTQDQPTTSEGLPPSPLQSKSAFRYSPWLAGFGEYAREHKQRQTPAFQTGAGGFVLASDFYGVHPELLLGSGIAYAHTHVHEDDGFGYANIDQGALVFYTAWAYRDYYFNMELWGSGYHAKNVREINLPGVIPGSAKSSTNGWQLTPHVEVGYDYKDNWLCVEPFMMIDWVANWERGFQEHGAGKLNMGQKGRFSSLLRNEWGVRVNETLTYDWGTVTFREKGSYAYQKAFRTGTLTAFLVGSSGTFVVSTLNGAQNLGVVELESLIVPRNIKYPYGTISYQGEFGSRYQSHQGMATIGMDF